MSGTFPEDKTTASGLPPETPGAAAPKPIGADGQHGDHWILRPEDLARGFVRPVRESYVHEKCKTRTKMPRKIAETYAAQPSFYGTTFCYACRIYAPVGKDGEFRWDDGSKVGT